MSSTLRECFVLLYVSAFFCVFCLIVLLLCSDVRFLSLSLSLSSIDYAKIYVRIDVLFAVEGTLEDRGIGEYGGCYEFLDMLHIYTMAGGGT